jgi:hypothetical protein
MIGPEGAADRAAEWLAERIPARLRVLEARLQLPPNTLADPARVIAHETGPIAIEDWPSVYVLPQRLERMDLVEVRGDASEVYRCRYLVRVILWVRADSYASTDRLRKRYALATREALLERKQLAAPATYGGGDYGQDTSSTVVDPSGIREDYSDVFTDDASRTIAGAYLDVPIIVTEVLDGPTPFGTVDSTPEVTTTGDTASIPPHPAL